MLRVVNFAHGEFVIAGSFLAFVLFTGLGVPPLWPCRSPRVAFFAAGWGLYYVLMPRLARSDDPELMSFLMFYGVSIARGGPDAAAVRGRFADDRLHASRPVSMQVGPVYVSTARLVALAITAVISIALPCSSSDPARQGAARGDHEPRGDQIMGVDIVQPVGLRLRPGDRRWPASPAC